MVSLLIPRIAKLIAGAGTAAEVYRLLEGHSYLSRRALSHREEVLGIIRKTRDAYPSEPAPGRELSRDTVDALEDAGFLSYRAMIWGKRLTTRY